MSIHKSLKVDKFKTTRNVRKRYERLQKLIRTEKFIEGLSIYGLPKEKILKLKIKIKEKKEEEGLTILQKDMLNIPKKGKK